MNILGFNGHSMDNGYFFKDNHAISIDSEHMVMDVISGHTHSITKIVKSIYGIHKSNVPEFVSKTLKSKKFGPNMVNVLWTLECLANMLGLPTTPERVLLTSINNNIFQSIPPYNKFGEDESSIIDFITHKVIFENTMYNFIPNSVLERIKTNIDSYEFSMIKDESSCLTYIVFSRGNNQLNLNFDANHQTYNGRDSIYMSLGFITSSYAFSVRMMNMDIDSEMARGTLNTNQNGLHSFAFRFVNIDEDDIDNYTLFAGFSQSYKENEIIPGVESMDMSLPQNNLDIN